MANVKYEKGEAERSAYTSGEVKKKTLSGGKVSVSFSNFEVRSSDLKLEHKKAIDQLILEYYLGRTCATATISLIEGYADAVGDAKVNANLRDLRANVVSGWITGRIKTWKSDYTGDEVFVRPAPLETYLNPQNNTPQARSDNRAVKIYLTPAKTLTQPFFRVTQSPHIYNKGMLDTCGIVSSDPWNEGKFTIRGVSIWGRREWASSVYPDWSKEVIYYNPRVKTLKQLLTTIVVHHTSNRDSIDKNERTLKEDRGFAAIGYHFAISMSGRVYQGRPLEVMGSHAGVGKKSGPLNDPDWGSVGIVLLGDFESAKENLWSPDEPSTAMLDSLKQLIKALKDEYAIGRLLMHKEVKGRSGEKTVCPGENVYEHVEKLRASLNMSK